MLSPPQLVLWGFLSLISTTVVAGSLPSGVSLDAPTCVLDGVPSDPDTVRKSLRRVCSVLQRHPMPEKDFQVRGKLSDAEFRAAEAIGWNRFVKPDDALLSEFQALLGNP